ncbi:MAG: tRNA (uridine(34)/cytosine(34)/5-carboxymethylaminomethyluridine(34)-2'-O)-methyltransferase TrmL [Proteobacteria bacterium]|nr:MAG: tRNA (uridine(34)/cytosine(34)/5-carboxymethylaminomethyluridine(34)-2'-O)-methyltransferase TrmL [Pseudomonadota bacterium]
MHVVLVNPQIPPNTGNIARLCAGTDTDLHLVGKLGFSLEDRYLKRAGLDYWPQVKLHLHDSLEALYAKHHPTRVAYFSSHATQPYTAFEPSTDAWFVFGREADGLPAKVRAAKADQLYKIPITEHVRSLNLANSVAVVLYDALRRHGFPGLR